MLFHWQIPNANLLFLISKGKAPHVLVALCHLWVLLQVISPQCSQKQLEKEAFFLLDCVTHMSQPNPDAVVLVCSSALT